MQQFMPALRNESAFSFRGGAVIPWMFIGLIVAGMVMSGGVSAHGGGPVRAVWDDARGFHMVIETNEDPAAGVFGGVVHVTMLPTATAQGTERLRGMHIEVHGVGPNGKTTRTVRAKQILNGPYEADIMVNRSGLWHFHIKVTDDAGEQTMSFPLEVMARSVATDIGIIGGLMLIPVLGVTGMVRVARRRQHAQAGKDNE